MKKKTGKFLLWLPRILSILLIIFLTLFSFDVFEPGLKWWEILLAFLMHNIPVFVLIAVLVIAWKHEIVGAVTFGLAGLLYVYLTVGRAQIPLGMAFSWSMIIAGPAFIIGFLFMNNWCNKRSNQDKQKPKAKR